MSDDTPEPPEASMTHDRDWDEHTPEEPDWLVDQRAEAARHAADNDAPYDPEWETHVARYDAAEKEPPHRPPEVVAAEDDADRSSWWPVHNATTTADLVAPDPPSILCREDGIGLFYPGTIGGLHGESGDGKSWLVQAGCLQEMQRGHHVWYLDFESRYDAVTQRLLDLGGDWDAIRPFWHYSSPFEPLVVKEKWTRGGIDLVEGLDTFAPTLVVVDGVTEAMDLHGLDPLKNDEYAAFRRMLLTRIADAGPCCTTVDHVNKDPDTRKGQAMGAQHKRAGMTGATYEVRTERSFARGRDGALKVVCAKDRVGYWYKGQTVAHVPVTSHGDGRLSVRFDVPAPSSGEQGDAFRPTGLMEKVSRYLEVEPDGASTRQIRREVRGKNEFIDKAIAALVAEGFIDPTSHAVIRPYRQSGDDEALEQAA